MEGILSQTLAPAPSVALMQSSAAERVNPARSPEKVAQDFEGVFASMLVKSMRESMSEDGLFAGDAGGVMGSFFDLYMGQHLAQQGGFGLAASLETAISRQIKEGNTAQQVNEGEPE